MSNKPEKQISEAYNIWHDSVHGKENLKIIDLCEWHVEALNLSPDLKDLEVLEVGCGAGDFSLYLSKQRSVVTAVDFSSKAIEIAKEKAKCQKIKVDFQIADAQFLPFKNNCFDLIFCCECLEHMIKPQLALNQFYRVLKPSGTLILTTENYSNPMILVWLLSWLKGVPFNSGAGVQPIENFFLFWKVKKMFNHSGFDLIKMSGWHHVFMLLPKFHPFTFVINKFQSKFLSSLLIPFARHISYKAIKNI